MKKLLTLAAAVVMMIAGNTRAWADEWSIDFSSYSSTVANKTGVTISDAVSNGMGTVTLGTEALNSNFGLQTGTSWLYYTDGRLYQFNSGGRNFGVFNAIANQLITLNISAAPDEVSNATLQSADGNVRKYKVTADGTVTFKLARYNNIYSISVSDPSATDVDYTVKYVDGDGNELKDASTLSGTPGEAVTIGATQKAAITKDGVKYVYDSDDADGMTIASDGSTVVTVTFKVATKYTCTATDNLGTTLASTEVYEGDAFTFYVPYFVYQGGKFYQSPAVSEGCTLSYAAATVSNITAATDVTVTYTEEEDTKVVFYAEAENIDGLTPYEDPNINSRMSNGKVAYAETDKTAIVTLPAGTYTITAATRYGKTIFYAGAAEDAAALMTLTSSGSVVTTTSDAFTLTAETAITISAGDNKNYLDYVVIRNAKTATTEPTEISASYTPSCGATDNSAAWWTAFSDGYTIADGEMANFKFYNYNSNDKDSYGNGNFYNFLMVAATNGVPQSDGYSEYFVLRADNYGWGTYYDGTGLSNTYDWTNYSTNMNGALVDMNVAYYGGLIKMTSTITAANGTEYTYNYTSPTGITADDITIFFTVEKAHISQNAPVSTTMAVSDAGYATFCAPFPAHIPAGITAYTVDGVEANGYTLTTAALSNCIPANTPVVLQAEAATSATVYGDKIESDNLTAGLLTGVYTDTPAPAGSYVLQTKSGVTGFYLVDETIPTVGANRAYLTTSSDVKALFLDNTGAETAISSIETANVQQDAIYNLAGQRLTKAQKGINIINGKKILK